MGLTKDHTQRVIREFQAREADRGSSEVQIALLTANITSLTEHLKTHKKDQHSRLGLLKMVSQRKRLLNYLNRTAPERHQRLIERLELRT